LSYEASDNSLRLTPEGNQPPASERIGLSGYVDMGAGGRLVGLEVIDRGTVYLGHALARWRDDEVDGEYVSVSEDSAYIELSLLNDTATTEKQGHRVIQLAIKFMF